MRLDRDVDRGVAAADDGDALPDCRNLAGLQPLDERKRLPHALEVVSLVGHVGIGPHSDRDHDRINFGLELLEPGSVDTRVKLELDTELGEQPRLVRQRLIRLAVRRDREADEASDLLALVVDRHGVAARGELTGCREPSGAGADDCDSLAVCRRAFAQRDAVGVGPVGCVSLQRPDLDRPAALVYEDAVALAEDFDGADAGAGAAEDVLGEDRCRRGAWLACCDRRDEARDVDAGWASDHAGRRRVRAATLETPVGLDDRRSRGQRRVELARQVGENVAHLNAVWPLLSLRPSASAPNRYAGKPQQASSDPPMEAGCRVPRVGSTLR